MSRENVDVVREVIEANRSDALDSRMAAILGRCDPRVEFRSVLAAVEGATYEGHDGVRSYFQDMAESWQEWRNELEEVLHVGPETVVVQIRFQAIGRDSGAEVEGRNAVIFVLADGKLLRVDSYPTREEALEAVGLSD